MGEQTLKKNDLPAGWEHTILKDVCEIVLGQSPPSETYNTDGIGLPFFQGKAEFTTLNPIAAKWCSIPGKIAEQNDILLSVRAPVGDTNIADRRCCIGRGLAALRFNHYKFLFYYMRSIEKELDKKGTGSTFKAISGEIVRNTNFPLPPLPEQHRIVAKIEELFSELDKGVEALKTAQQQLKVYRQAVLKWAFEGKLTEVWRRQQKDLPTASQLLEQIRTEREKQAKATGKKLKPEVPLTEADLTELSKLPEDWGWVRMGHIAEACLGKMLDANKNKGTPKPYLRNSNVRWGAFDLSDLQEMKFEDGEDERYGVRKGDLIVCEGGEPGRAAIWNDQIPDMKIQKALHRVRFSEFAQSKYVLFFLVLSSKNGHLDKYFTGTTIKHLPGEKLAIFPLPLCSVDEQRLTVEEIESRLSVADKIEETITQSLKQAEALRQSILKKAFSGKLVPQDPNDEPAEKLLALIKAEKAAQPPLRSQRRRDNRPEALKRGPLLV